MMLSLRPLMRTLLLFLLAFGLLACGGGGGTAPPPGPPPNPLPSITSLSQSSATVGGGDFTLTVNGNGFISTSVVRWNGIDRPTTFVSSVRLDAAIPASDIATVGTPTVTVFNPSPGGGTSNSVDFAINNPVPGISSLTPPSLLVGGADFTLTVTGSGFISDSMVRWNEVDRVTTFVSDTELQAAILAGDIATAGTPSVTVFNPAPGGGSSNAVTFFVNNPPPSVTALTPTNILAGQPDFTLVVTGADFVADSVVRWNGADRATTLISSTELQAVISANDITFGALVDITVFTAPPAGGTAGPLTFTVNNPAPTLTGFSPASIPAGQPDFTLTVNGTEFVPTSVVNFNGTDRPTTFVDSTQIRIPLTQSEILLDHTAPVTVSSPSPGGGVSGVVDFSIDPAPGAFERVNPATTDPLKSGVFDPSLSATGRMVAFVSLIQGDSNDLRDATVRDTCLLAPPGCTPATARASVDDNGTEADDATTEVSLSADGRFVAFRTAATNLVPNDTNGTDDIFVHDRDADGDRIFDEPGEISTLRVSVTNSGGEADDASFQPSISASGRFVAFHSQATNLVANDTNNAIDVFVRDTCAGEPATCTPSTVRASVTSNGGQVVGGGSFPWISADGRFVSFTSSSSTLVSNDGNGLPDAFVHDRDTDGNSVFDESGGTSTIRVSLDSSSNEIMGSFNTAGQISADGRFVLFGSQVDNVVPGDSNGFSDLFIRDTCVEAPPGCTPSTIRASLANDGSELNDQPAGASLSADGRFVAFGTNATNAISNDTNGFTDIFVRDTCLGADASCVSTTIRVTVANEGTESNHNSQAHSINANGRFIAFESQDVDLVPGTSDGLGDIFVGRTGFSPTNPVPSITLLSPPNTAPNGPEFTLTVTGTDFVPVSVVQWNGQDRPTIYVSRTKLLVRIAASDVATAGIAQVTVVNPLPGGGTSTSLTFTIN